MLKTIKEQQAVIASLRKQIENQERKMVQELPFEMRRRFQIVLRHFRTKDRRVLRARIAAYDEKIRQETEAARRRNGAIPGEIWEALLQCTHPDGNPSIAIKARAFDGLREREKMLRTKT